MSQQSNLVTGTKGFIVQFSGVLPPDIEALGEEASVSWVVANFTVLAPMLAFCKESNCAIVPLANLSGDGSGIIGSIDGN